MSIFQIIGIGIISAVLSVLIKQHRPELAIFLPIAGSILIIFCIIPHLKSVLYVFENITESAGIDNEYIKIVIKVIGVAYICQFASDICKDAGELSIASKIDFGGKILILSLSMPIIYSLLELIKKIINF